MDQDPNRSSNRLKQRAARALNWAAFIVLFLCIGIAFVD